MLTARDGLKIARKLDAEVAEARKHTRVRIVIDDVLIGAYGVSIGSRESNHDYIASQIGGISSRQARDLSRCPLSKEEYVRIIRQKGLL